MLFFLNLDGTVTRSDTDHVYQGQNKVANVELFTLISPTEPIKVAFTLPNGLTTTYLPMSYVGAYSVDKSNQKQVYHWKLAMPYNVTEVEGKVGVSFNLVLKVVKDETSGETLETINQTTYTSSFLVEYSTLPIPPTTVNNDEIQQILDLLDLYYAQNKDLINKQVFVVGTVNTNTLGANQQASVAVEQSTTPDSNGNYPTNFTFSIPQGIQGTQGEVGETPDVSAVAEVNNTVGTPSVEVEKSGTKENPVFNFKFSNIKGQKGDSGIGNAKLSNAPGTSDTDGYTQKTVNGIVQNPNLLINPNFAINQRGQTSYTGTQQRTYCVDRWYLQYNSTFETTTKKVSLIAQYASFRQTIENYKGLIGKTVTFSISVSNVSGNDLYMNTTESQSVKITTDGVYTVTVTPSTSITEFKCGLFTSTSTGKPSCVVNWAKLEIGSVATEFSPPSIAEELPKCQRYYQIRSTSYTIETNAIDRPIPMRVNGTIGTTTIDSITYNYADAEL